MGLSTASLHLYGANLAQLAPLLPDSLLLREQNAPWLELLLPETAEGGGAELEKLAKKLTKADPEAAALLFIYFDDEMFSCSLYRGGKKAAGCLSQESWAKLGKALDALFGDELAGKAFRYAARCVDLEEKVRLLEESVGAALLDCAEFEPRTVPRGDGTLRAVKAREAALKKRPNQCALTELPVEDWPVDWQAQLGLYERIRPEWRRYDAATLLFDFGADCYSVPRHPELAFHRVLFGDGGDMARRYLLYSLPDGTLEDRKEPAFEVFGPLWLTKQGDPVLLACEYETVQTPFGPRRDYGKPLVVCLGQDDSVRWSVYPAGAERSPDSFHASPEGILTLYSRGNSYTATDAQLCRIDGETGALLVSRVVPAAENLDALLPVEALKAFAYIANQKEIVLLDENLEEIRRWPCPRHVLGPQKKNIVGDTLWDQDISTRALRLYDLRTGACREITPEVPTFVRALLPDGRFLGGNERGTELTVFDATGRVISRHRAQGDGAFTKVRAEADGICILENRSPDTHGFVSDELFEQTSFHVWRLDYA